MIHDTPIATGCLIEDIPPVNCAPYLEITSHAPYYLRKVWFQDFKRQGGESPGIKNG